MASHLNLRQYQDNILSRLDAALSSDTSRHKAFLGVAVGALNILIDMRQVTEVLPVPDIYHTPNTRHWFLGTANIRGNLYAVSHFGAFLQEQDGDVGISHEANKNQLRIVLLQAELAPHTAILIDRLIGLRGLENLKKVSSSTLNNTKKKKTKEEPVNIFFMDEKYEDDDGNLWQLLDCQALVNLKAFMQAGL